MHFLYKISLIFILLIGGSVNLFAQNDLPSPTPYMITFPQGSIVVAMDNNNQAIGGPFNLKAYGLLNLLLQHEIKLNWIINSGKAWDGIDFSATAIRETPTPYPNTFYEFRGGPFIIDSLFADTARSIINMYGNDVCTYQLTQAVTVDRRYQLIHKPNIAVLSNGGNQNIHLNYLQQSGFLLDTTINMAIAPPDTLLNITPPDTQTTITPADTLVNITPADTQMVINGTDTSYVITPADTAYTYIPADTTYIITPADTQFTYIPADTTYYNTYTAPWVTVIPASDVLDWGGCYTFASEPHWDSSGDTTHTHPVKRFLYNGSNFLAQCEGVETYEDDDTIQTTGGIDRINAKITHAYFNADMPYAQIHGELAKIGGSLRNWSLSSGSSWRSFYYRMVGSANGVYDVASAAKILPNNYVGGNAFYLGGHDYGGSTNNDVINGIRMYLNCIFVPANPLGVCSQLFALPIELLSLDAEYTGDEVEIMWTTSTETNNQYFTIERTLDGENFTFVDRVPGAGTSSTPVSYKTYDQQPVPGVSYYRLSQTDFDGTTWYSELVPVKIKGRDDIFYVAPNPTTPNEIIINFNSWETGAMKIVMENIMGQVIYSETFQAQTGDFYRKKITPRQEISNGIYIISIHSDNRSQNQKIIIK